MSDNKARMFYPKHPDWQGPADARFDVSYRTIARERYLISGMSPPKKLYGTQKPRKCAFCGRTDSEATFKTDAHVLPAFLANRHILSLEECDDCNRHYGLAHETNLSAMLRPLTVFGGIRRRAGDGLPRLKRPGGSSYLGFRSDVPVLEAIQHPNDPSISVERLPGNEIKIQAPQPPYRPISACKSLLRSVWMVLPLEARRRHSVVLGIVNDTIPTSPFQIWRLCFPRLRFPWVDLRVFEKVDPKTPGGELVVLLALSNEAFVWTSPTENSASYAPSLLPPVASVLPPNGTLQVFTSDDLLEPSPLSVTFEAKRIEKVTSGEQFSLIEKKGSPLLERNVYLECGDPSNAIRIRCSLKYRYFDFEAPRFELFGGQLAGRIQINGQNRNGKARFGYNFQPHLVSAEDALQTLLFLRNVLHAKAPVRIMNADTEEELHALCGDTAAVISFPDNLEQLLLDLILVNTEFKTDLRFTEELEACPSELISVAQAIRTGFLDLSVPEGELGIGVYSDTAMSVIAGLELGDDIFTGPFSSSLEIAGIRLDLGEQWTGLIAPKPLNPITELRERALQLKQGEIMHIPVTCNQLRRIYRRWAKELPTITGSTTSSPRN